MTAESSRPAGSKSAFFVSDIKARAKMDQNEAPFDLPASLKDTVLRELKRSKWNHYPQPGEYHQLQKKFAKGMKLDPANIFFAAGADQVIFAYFLLVMQRFGPKAKILIFTPTYPVFRHYAKILQLPYDEINLGPDYQINKRHLRKHYDLIVVVSPNNPTGNLIDEAQLTYICKHYTKSLILIDEAYHHFSGQTYLDWFQKYKNILIARSFSKVQLAGTRVGYGIVPAKMLATIEYLLGIPYNLNQLQLAIIKHYPKLQRDIAKVVSTVEKEKERYYDFFNQHQIAYKVSAANYILFSVSDPDMVYERLLEASVKIRNVSHLPGLTGWLRVTIRSPKENNLFFRALGRFM